jgi:hypothetical protein
VTLTVYAVNGGGFWVRGGGSNGKSRLISL